MTTISEEERVRFATWCRQQAETTYQLAEQSKKLNINSVLEKKLLAEAHAYTIVAAKLTGGEKMTISKGGALK